MKGHSWVWGYRVMGLWGSYSRMLRILYIDGHRDEWYRTQARDKADNGPHGPQTTIIIVSAENS